MGLTSALYTGLSGLNANQTTLSVVGNNIANVNTVAFKASTALFTPQFYVTQQSGTAPNGDFGGTNPSQEGLGTQVAAIQTDFSDGSISSTGVASDMAIDGQGFFITQSGAGTQYTRDGSFTLDSSNQLVTASGSLVQGYAADGNGNIIQGALQSITIPLGQSTVAKATTTAKMTGNLNSSGTVAGGASILTSQSFSTVGGTAPTATTPLVDLMSTSATPAPLVAAGDVLSFTGTQGSRTLPTASLTVTSTTTVGDLQNFLNDGLNIDPTVSEPGNPPPGATLQTSGTTSQLTIIGNTGTENAITLGSAGITDSSGATPFTIAGGTDGTYTNDPTGESTHTTVTAYDSLGAPVTVDLTAVLESKTTTGTTWRYYASAPDTAALNSTTPMSPIVGGGTLNFDTNGNLLSSSGTQLTIPRSETGAATPLNVNLDFSGVTSLSSTTSQMVMSSQDGLPIGSLSSYSVGNDGTITGAYSNGQTKALGQVALASFNNPEGLVNNGGNTYTTGANSGVAIVAPPGTLGTGQIRAESLEQSNVDISKEFINLIVASTGFNAASKVISTSDTLLTQLMNTTQA